MLNMAKPVSVKKETPVHWIGSSKSDLLDFPKRW
jgi:hypothetical protein